MDCLHAQDLLSATGIAGIFYLTLTMIGYGLSSGVLMLMSRSAGKNDSIFLGKIFSNGVLLSLILSFFLLGISWFAAPYIFEQFISNVPVKHVCHFIYQNQNLGIAFYYAFATLQFIFFSYFSFEANYCGICCANDYQYCV
ncbi:MAG: hypothetical protein IPK62_13510 [Bacteroidetes bacterium]|nr:hypothetical protein [Bacteroidota bacterium]